MKALIVNSQVLAVGAADVTDAAVVVNGVVFPLTVIGDYELVDAASSVQPGWGYSGSEFAPPVASAAPVPFSVSMRKAELQLLEDGLLDDVDALIETLPRASQIEWRRATEVERGHPLVELIRQQKGLTNQQIDDMFVNASVRP